MAQFFPYFEEVSVAEQIKSLPNDELLDFWEETQYIDKFMEREEPAPVYSLEYERAVLQELQIRSCLGRLDVR
ncbi:MAG: hypothetical protein R6U22_07420 [Desulfohalobiaceae bacterium]|jgi:hypothetical protein